MLLKVKANVWSKIYIYIPFYIYEEHWIIPKGNEHCWKIWDILTYGYTNNYVCLREECEISIQFN